MSNAARLRNLKAWVAEFKRHFGVTRRIYCFIDDLSKVKDPSCGNAHSDCHGLSEVTKSAKVGRIWLDPRAWESKDGPYAIALHEFIHVWMRFRANDPHEGDAEEEAVCMLTDLLMPQVAQHKPEP
jgi:hypothetical protein